MIAGHGLQQCSGASPIARVTSPVADSTSALLWPWGAICTLFKNSSEMKESVAPVSIKQSAGAPATIPRTLNWDFTWLFFAMDKLGIGLSQQM